MSSGPRHVDEPGVGRSPTLGELCRVVRRSRDLSSADVERLGGPSRSAVQRFESGSMPKQGTFAAYLGALANEHAPRPLAPADADFLWQAFLAAASARRSERAFLHVAYDEAAARTCPAALKQLLARARSHPYPAMVRDELWFVHAMNDGVLRMAGMTPDDPMLHQWAFWNIVGSYFQPRSPFAAAIVDDTLAQAAVRRFLRSALPLLFTTQMGALRRRLAQLSPESFGAWWLTASTLLLPEQPEAIGRTWRVDGGIAQLRIGPIETVHVELLPGVLARFALISWQPLSEASAQLVTRRGSDGRRKLILAADYDTEADMHVNAWPEVLQSLPDD